MTSYNINIWYLNEASLPIRSQNNQAYHQMHKNVHDLKGLPLHITTGIYITLARPTYQRRRSNDQTDHLTNDKVHYLKIFSSAYYNRTRYYLNDSILPIGTQNEQTDHRTHDNVR